MSIDINRRYKLGKRIGAGAFGEIYEGSDESGNTVAIKLEQKGCEYPQLRYESRIYHELQGIPGIPQMLYSGTEGLYNVLVLERLGLDLESILQSSPDNKLTLGETLKFGQEALTILENFHNRGFVHRDIKPDNFLTDSRGKGLYLIDFGLSKYLRDSNGHHIEPNNHKNLTGTPRYASIANHKGKDQGRRDDLEGLGYVMIYLLKGSLPWQDLSGYGNILRNKQSMLSSGKMFKDVPPSFYKYFKYVSSLGFSDRPDYSYLRRLFKRRDG
jgi:serine/threonine protein kinase